MAWIIGKASQAEIERLLAANWEVHEKLHFGDLEPDPPDDPDEPNPDKMIAVFVDCDIEDLLDMGEIDAAPLPFDHNKRIAELLMGKPLQVDGDNTFFQIKSYSPPESRIALRLIASDGIPYGMLTVNIPEADLLPGEILVKTWSENETLAAAALASGHFKDTGKRVPTGFCEAQVWEVIA